MHVKLASIAALSLTASLAAVPAMADHYYSPAYGPYAAYNHYDIYQGPHGHYRSLSALVRDINGTPCGEQCTYNARRYWMRHSYAPYGR